jgi:hypothetical protein
MVVIKKISEKVFLWLANKMWIISHFALTPISAFEWEVSEEE